MHYQIISFLLVTLFSFSSFGQSKRYRKEELEKVKIKDSFYDENVDYSTFTGRVTDRDKTSNIFKISSESSNIKFFRAGDFVKFRLAGKKTKMCSGFIRNVENKHFVLYVKDLYPCWKDGEYFRRGTLLYFDSDKLAARVRDASLYRVVLINRRRDFLKQLNDVNHFIWSFEQEKVKLAAEFDEKIIQLEKIKQRALEQLFVKKSDNLNLQKELIFRMDELDRDLSFYRIEKDELLYDRWHLDQDLGLPISRRPKDIVYR